MARFCDLQPSDHTAHQVAASKAEWEWQRLWVSEGWLPALLLLVHHRRPCVKSPHLSETQVHVPVQQPGLKPRLGNPRPALCSSSTPTLLFWFEGLPFLPSLWDVMRTERVMGEDILTLEVTAFVIIVVVVDVTLWASSCRKPSLLWPQHSSALLSGSLGLNSVFLSSS